MKSFAVHTRARREMVDITGAVRSAVTGLGVKDGVCCVFVPHTTCGLVVNENADPAVASDILAGLASMVPGSAAWRHAEGNSDAHIQAVLTGCSVMVPVEDGALLLGTWQGVFLCEFDGPRVREVRVKVIGAKSGT